jgi:hypothetical protein
MRRVIVVALVVLVAVLAATVVRVFLASRGAWRRGEALVAEYNRSAGEARDAAADPAGVRRARLLRDAVVEFREAALWHLPGSPYVRRALDRLIVIGQRAEQSGDDALALFAYRAARTSVLGTRSILGVDDEHLDRADRAIARVSARLERPPPPGEEAPPAAERERRHRATLAPVPAPDPWWSLAAAAGLLAWIGGALLFALRGLDARCRVRGGVALRAGIVVVSGLGAWVAGLALA